jgi:hypothetical protein
MINKNFSNYLLEQGVSETRTTDITEAVKRLHHSLCSCDFENRSNFFNAFPSIQNLLNAFGNEEEMTNNF